MEPLTQREIEALIRKHGEHPLVDLVRLEAAALEAQLKAAREVAFDAGKLLMRIRLGGDFGEDFNNEREALRVRVNAIAALGKPEGR